MRQDDESKRLVRLNLLDAEAAKRAPIIHAPWPTGVPPVCTAYWDQEAWDRFAEGFRPKGYTGDIRDFKSYMIWGARKLVDEGRMAQRCLQDEGKTRIDYESRITAARFREALEAAGACRESRKRDDKHRTYHEMGECFVCTVARIARGER